MQAKKPLTDRTIRTLKPAAPGKRRLVWDAIVPGLGVRVTDQGVRTFVLVTRYPGAPHPAPRSLGSYGAVSLEDARVKARAWLKLIASGIDPRAEDLKAAEDTLQAIAEEYIAREGKKLRTAEWRRDVLERLVYPSLGRQPIDKLRRSDIVRLLDQIETKRGPVMADRTLAIIRKIMNWHATRSDEFRSPIVKGMARTKPKDRARQRTLEDAELQALWPAATGTFGAFVQFTLLTATRRNEAAQARHAEIRGADWTIPGTRYKTGADHLVPLSKAAQAVLATLPRGGDFIFSTNGGKTPISGFSKFKQGLDKASGVSGWTLHDLRRSARSLMSRAGVPSDYAERCLGHTMAGVRGTYDRHEFYEEKRSAFEALATQIDRIIRPQDNVVEIGRGR